MRRNRAVWSAEEDEALKRSVETHGPCKWGKICRRAGLNRCQKSCRLRWKNYLRPGINRGIISEDEDDLILRMHKLIGNRWSLIAGRLPGRKNHWNSYLSKRFLSDKGTRNIKVHGDNNHRLIVQSESKSNEEDDADEERSPSYSDHQQLPEPKGCSNFHTFLADLEMYLNADYVDPQSSTGRTNNDFHLAEWINELCDEDGFISGA